MGAALADALRDDPGLAVSGCHVMCAEHLSKDACPLQYVPCPQCSLTGIVGGEKWTVFMRVKNYLQQAQLFH